VDAAKIQLELIEFQWNVAVKEIFLMAYLKASCQRKVSPNFFPLLANFQWKFSLCLGLSAAAGGGNCLLLQATVNVKLGPPFSLYIGFSIRLVFSSFLDFLENFSVISGFSLAIYILIHHHFSGSFLSVAGDTPAMASGLFSATFSLLALASSCSYATDC